MHNFYYYSVFPPVDVSSGMASKLTGGGLISKVLLANADALCAAVSPLVQEELDLYVLNAGVIMWAFSQF